ncbi:hypothetical protein [Sinorhizobium fredii]|uniref:hypothetical protein n=1 Tax=Rhizobium fredii TaxID=380 RepID=UPI0004BA4C12|nr:hypothetical protein [Sinorhizobium fredii]
MLILGIDPSVTQCGLALYRFPGQERDIECFSFSANGDTAEEKCADFGLRLHDFCLGRRPDFICLEAAMRLIAGYQKRTKIDLGGKRLGYWTPNADQLVLPEIQGHVRQLAIDRGMGFETVAVKTWRADLYGRGGGSLGKDEAKRRAREYCRWLGIAAKNHNEAEAACVAIWASRCSQTLRLMRAGMAG